MLKTILPALVILALSFAGFHTQDETKFPSQIADTSITKTTNDMHSFISIFEIPAAEISRSVNFYQAILDLKIEMMEMPGMKMGLFPFEDQSVFGTIVEGEGFTPSADGITVYFNAGDNLQVVLDRVEVNGGKILIPKSPHADESGYFALFLDSEGNRMGLHSPN